MFPDWTPCNPCHSRSDLGQPGRNVTPFCQRHFGNEFSVVLQEGGDRGGLQEKLDFVRHDASFQ